MRKEASTIAGQHRLTVSPDDSSSRWGNPGFELLSTPAVLGHTEVLCAELLTPYLDPGEMTVGLHVLLNHHAPAQVGDDVVIEATAPGAGSRTEFRFEVKDVHGNILCDGIHQRAVVETKRFRKRLLDDA